ncbi:PHP domain-containing protein [Rhodococcus sp. D2-41]|uniref:PHP domain-containing protein n=1 Tax=Speluncibacter jeojiensis TaxID=2710754 RepID=UPI00240F7133|nr:PHP domain-containing protein [Rhodococcus sp. D2-41]MDG3010650.1 PHP domain-containing protein [Rhodococcus sp. D2-41]
MAERFAGWVTDPAGALREIAFWLERARADGYRINAYRRAADVLDGLGDREIEKCAATGGWDALPGIGAKTAAVIRESAESVPAYLTQLRSDAEPISGGGDLRDRLRGDLHTHTDWSDGGSPLDEMMATAERLGHSYCAVTDHSPRLTIAHGLSPERLRTQLGVIAELGERVAPMRVLTGIEVDICDDGSLDQDEDLLAELDVVVASVHSHLRDDRATMTRRMVAAVRNPHVDVLGHCTGRLVQGARGTRPESTFDAQKVFRACRDHDTAVEINCRPERRDPPGRLLELACAEGCLFAIDTDAHAPGQLDWLGYGCERAQEHGIEPERVINTWSLDELLDWTAPV